MPNIEALVSPSFYPAAHTIAFMQVGAVGLVSGYVERDGVFQAMFETATIGLLVAGPDLTIQLVNQTLCDLVGRSAAELVGMRFADLVHPQDQLAEANIVADLRSGPRGSRDSERRLVRPDGSFVWVRTYANVPAVGDKYARIFVQVINIDEHKNREAELRAGKRALKANNRALAELATHDSLTGLPNRSLLNDRLNLGLRRLGRSDSALALLYVDLDGFKKVNDSHGHGVGDELLVEVAKSLCQAVRPPDTVARIGGDEFVVICNDIDRERDAMVIAGRIVRRFKRTFDIGDLRLVAKASIGYVISRSRDDDPDSLIAQADAAMYRSKVLGKPVRAC